MNNKPSTFGSQKLRRSDLLVSFGSMFVIHSLSLLESIFSRFELNCNHETLFFAYFDICTCILNTIQSTWKWSKQVLIGFRVQRESGEFF